MENGKTKLSLGGHNQLKLVNGVLLIKDLPVKTIIEKFGAPTFFFHSELIKKSTQNIMNIFEKVFSSRFQQKNFQNKESEENTVMEEKLQNALTSNSFESRESVESRDSIDSRDSCEKRNNQTNSELRNPHTLQNNQKYENHTKGFYSVKSNYLEPVLDCLNEMKFGFEVITEPELNLLIRMQIDPTRILCGGPYFPLSLMEKAIKYGIQEYVIYDLEDLIALNEIAQKNSKILSIILRFVQYKYEARVGIPAIDESFKKLAEITRKSFNVKIIGILNHYASQMNSIEVYQKNAEFLVDIANKLLHHCRIRCSVFDIGGGFPESFVFPDAHFCTYLQEMKNIFEKNNWANVNIYYEPGRYIVGGAGFLLSTIVRRNNHFSTLFLDVGTNLIPLFARSSIRLHNVEKIECEQKRKFDIMGIIPSDQDLLAKNYNFEAESEVGDHVIISGVGAYTLTFSNRFPYAFPAIVFYENGEFYEYRSRGDSRDIALN